MREVFDRIVHCHLSDTGYGHLGDLVPLTVESWEFFQEWISAIREAYNRAYNLDRSSHCVTLEMELTQSRENIGKGVELLRSLLR